MDNTTPERPKKRRQIHKGWKFMNTQGRKGNLGDWGTDFRNFAGKWEKGAEFPGPRSEGTQCGEFRKAPLRRQQGASD